MAYCDYGFYKTEYCGNVIAEADFPRLAKRASEKIDLLTFDRLQDGLPTDERIAKKVKEATCALAEKMADIELANQTIRNSGGGSVASVSSGSESISFRNDTEFISEKEVNRICRLVAIDYLRGTGLLYAGF